MASTSFTSGCCHVLGQPEGKGRESLFVLKTPKVAGGTILPKKYGLFGSPLRETTAKKERVYERTVAK